MVELRRDLWRETACSTKTNIDFAVRSIDFDVAGTAIALTHRTVVLEAVAFERHRAPEWIGIRLGLGSIGAGGDGCAGIGGLSFFAVGFDGFAAAGGHWDVSRVVRGGYFLKLLKIRCF